MVKQALNFTKPPCVQVYLNLISFLFASADHIAEDRPALSAVVEDFVDLHEAKVAGQQHKPEEHEENDDRAQEAKEQGRCNRYQCTYGKQKIRRRNYVNSGNFGQKGAISPLKGTKLE